VTRLSVHRLDAHRLSSEFRPEAYGWKSSEAHDTEVSEHLICCSPCFNRCMEILAGLKQRQAEDQNRRDCRTQTLAERQDD